MRIGINGRFLVGPQTGVQRVSRNLVLALLETAPRHDYFLFAPVSVMEDPHWHHRNLTLVPQPVGEHTRYWNHGWEQWGLPMACRNQAIDVLFCPANTGPLFGRTKTVVHLHDTSFVDHPEWFSWGFRHYYNTLIPRLMKSASAVTTVSETSRRDILKHFSPPEVVTIPNGIDEALLRPSSFEPETDDFILAVGAQNPRKNPSAVIDAFTLVRKRNPALSTKLVLLGGDDRVFARHNLNSSPFETDILRLGHASDEELVGYYRKARAFVYPSLYEGFGLPPLEAMAHGTPVVASNCAALTEVLEDAALLVDPANIDGIARAVERLLTDAHLAQSLVEKGRIHAQKFRWLASAKRLLGVIERVAAGEYPVGEMKTETT